ncbi:MAG: YdcF family protein [Lachnospiraceae bacterium]|nr:YdcF family protein [Lachnospiraceae bacterium]
MEWILGAAGAFCFVYFVVCGVYAGFGASFLGIWPVLGVFLTIWALSMHQAKAGHVLIHLPRGLKLAVSGVLLLGVLVFAVMEMLIASQMFATGEENLDYLIVLGAQVRGDTVSVALEARLESAKAYLEENPDTQAVLSGGQGSGENLTEAKAMYEWLTERGIDGSRLILEEASTSTWENLTFSRELIGSTDVSVGIVTNNFHVYRGTMLARCAGFSQVSGIAAESHTVMQLHFLVREGLALAKDLVRYRLL